MVSWGVDGMAFVYGFVLYRDVWDAMLFGVVRSRWRVRLRVIHGFWRMGFGVYASDWI